MQLPPLDPPIEDLAPTASVLTSYDRYLNSQPVSICVDRKKHPGFAVVWALARDETDFRARNRGGYDGQAF